MVFKIVSFVISTPISFSPAVLEVEGTLIPFCMARRPLLGMLSLLRKGQDADEVVRVTDVCCERNGYMIVPSSGLLI